MAADATRAWEAFREPIERERREILELARARPSRQAPLDRR